MIFGHLQRLMKEVEKDPTNREKREALKRELDRLPEKGPSLTPRPVPSGYVLVRVCGPGSFTYKGKTWVIGENFLLPEEELPHLTSLFDTHRLLVIGKILRHQRTGEDIYLPEGINPP